MTTQTVSPAATMMADWRDYFALLKPRVMTLVVFSAVCGLLEGRGLCVSPGSDGPLKGYLETHPPG